MIWRAHLQFNIRAADQQTAKENAELLMEEIISKLHISPQAVRVYEIEESLEDKA